MYFKDPHEAALVKSLFMHLAATPKVILGSGFFQIDFMASGFQGTAFWNCMKLN